MTCQDFEPFLFAYVDGEFDGLERADADTHLATCDACRREVEEQRAYKRRMREAASAPSALNPTAPSDLRARLSARLDAEARPRRLFSRPAMAAAAALAAAASVAVAVYLRAGFSREQANALVAAAIAHHQGDLPLDVQDAQVAHVRDWMRGRVDFAPSRIPELRNAALRGARLSNLNGRPAALVVYGSPTKQRRVSLLVFDAPELRLPTGRRIADRDVLLANQRGYNVAVWKDREIAYSLVSDLDEQDILELVAASER